MDKKTWSKIYRYSKKLKALNYSGGKCQNCGETNFFKLAFHHTDAKTKKSTICDIKLYNWDVVKSELDKCELLCNNCHHELHDVEETICGDNRFKNNKKIYLEFKGVSSCQECGYNKCNSCLAFRHITGENKFLISEINVAFKSVSDLSNLIETELNKCEVLCRNCQVYKSSDVDFFKKYKAQIIEKSGNIRKISRKIDKELVSKLYLSGMKQIDIAKKLNVSKSAISGIIKGANSQDGKA